MQKAAELVRAHVADPAAQAATVDRFLDELDEMAPSDDRRRDRCDGATARRQPRGARRSGRRSSTSVAGGLDADGLTTLADELAAVATLLIAETALNKHLAEPTDDAAAKVALVDRLLDRQGRRPALDIVAHRRIAALVRPRPTWSTPSSTSLGWRC